MTYSFNSKQALSVARNDLVIFREINTLMEQVIADAGNGLYETTVSDGTTMTESTPDIVVTGTVANPTITSGQTIILGGTTLVLGTTGTSLKAIIADINGYFPNLVATATAANRLVLTKTTTAGAWTFTVGAGTANTALGLTATTHTATNPDSVSYFSVWNGATTDRAKTDQMSQVIAHFESLGYGIEQRTNTTSTNTFKWVITY